MNGKHAKAKNKFDSTENIELICLTSEGEVTVKRKKKKRGKYENLSLPQIREKSPFFSVFQWKHNVSDKV